MEPFVGEIRLFAFNQIPRGWLPCQGQIMPIQQYTTLFSLLGTMYGGNGVSTFALPDLRGRVPLQTSPDYPQGALAGTATHTLTINEMPAHTHTVSASSEARTLIPPKDNVWPQSANTYSAKAPDVQMGPTAISAAGSSQAHNNMQPYLTLSFCIATTGIFPSRP